MEINKGGCKGGCNENICYLCGELKIKSQWQQLSFLPEPQKPPTRISE